jgi:hypothetical protein
VALLPAGMRTGALLFAGLIPVGVEEEDDAALREALCTDDRKLQKLVRRHSSPTLLRTSQDVPDDEDEDEANDGSHRAREPATGAASPGAPQQPVELEISERKAKVILYVVSFNAFLVMACNTMFLPALRTVQEELHTSTASVTLALTSYMMASAIQPLIAGPLADVVGRKKPMVAAHVTFIVASICAAIAPSVQLLVRGRVSVSSAWLLGLSFHLCGVCSCQATEEMRAGPDCGARDRGHRGVHLRGRGAGPGGRHLLARA